jgi:hypothetical protein
MADKKEAAVAAVHDYVKGISNEAILKGWVLDSAGLRLPIRKKLQSADMQENTEGRDAFFAHVLPRVQQAIQENDTTYLIQHAAAENEKLSFTGTLQKQCCIVALHALQVAVDASSAKEMPTQPEVSQSPLDSPQPARRRGWYKVFGGRSGEGNEIKRH